MFLLNVVYNTNNYNVQVAPDFYLISSDSSPTPTAKPTLTLLRGGTYTFNVNQDTQFRIQQILELLDTIQLNLIYKHVM
jgi:hypothetical protein